MQALSTQFPFQDCNRSAFRCVQVLHNKRGKQKWQNPTMMELPPFVFDVSYRPGIGNIAADTLSRSVCASTSSQLDLKRLHATLRHPVATHMMHFVRAKNLPFYLEDTQLVIKQCQECAELKPRFFKSSGGALIKATQTVERVSIDFKEPLPSMIRNKYLLTVVDEYSRFPFVYACPDKNSSTVISCLVPLFVTFDLPNFVHLDRGSPFFSDEIRRCLHEKGIATSWTTPYDPRGNGQVGRLNGTLWKAITFSLRSKGLQTSLKNRFARRAPFDSFFVVHRHQRHSTRANVSS
ncbi:pro-Pol polyprotein [Clonorchis sinensis]|uniref:Pro-Pol polyprotein n=1 Tax=Clonorchis sinensis TaxID=79923 RepID=G7Y9A3_CLOSI|nr:pro-Pol polyprotein [Clonorchis sinensis]